MNSFQLSLLAAVCLAPLAMVHAEEPKLASVSLSRLTEADLPANAIWVDGLDLTHIATRGRKLMAGKSVHNTPLTLDGFVYPHGVGMAGTSLIRFNLKRAASQFLADFNIDDATSYGWVNAQLYVDGKKVSEALAKPRRKTDKGPAKLYRLSADLMGASELVVALTTETYYSHDLAGARFILVPGATERPEIIPMPDAQASATGDPANVVWVDNLNSLYISSGDGKPAGIKCAPSSLALVFGGTVYGSGYSAYPRSRLPIDLKGNATRFLSQVGVNDPEGPGARDAVTFKVYVDKKVAYDGGEMHSGDALKTIDLDLAGAKELLLAVDGDASSQNLPVAAWVGARMLVSATAKDRKLRPESKPGDQVPMPIASVVDGPQPAIHGPRVAGSSPGRPFFFSPYRLPVKNR